jgi:aspartyl-tRNA(Asn)/glutamyl-tRNA(Gln) amidotransferase subunit A
MADDQETAVTPEPAPVPLEPKPAALPVAPKELPGEDVAWLTARELVEAYRSKRLSPAEVADAVLLRIEALNSRLNAFCWRDGAKTKEAAKASEARWLAGAPLGPVDGVPTSIKDVLLTDGAPTLRVSKTVDRWRTWNEDAPTVARLRAAGAVFIGKTTTPEFGWKGVTDSPRSGVTRNPWNLERTPGGSSGGASAAVAAGLGPLTLGTDGGGSIRIPAGFTGIFGLKPTFGRVPAYPPSPFGTLAHVGPMTRDVGDAALIMNVITRPDVRDWYALADDGRDYLDGLDAGVAGLRVAFSPDLGFVRVAAEVAASVAKAATALSDLGAHVEVADPGFHNPQEMFRTLWYAGAAGLFRTISAQKRKQVDPGLLEIVAEGESLSALDVLAAEKARATLGIVMNQFHERFDLLVTPALPMVAFEAGREVPEGWWHPRWFTWTPFTYPFNLTRQPAASVPCGFSSDGLPIGVQIVGPLGADAVVLRAARALEQALPWAGRKPALAV